MRPGPFKVLVLGSGVAGLSAAVRLAGPAPHGGPSPSLGVLTKGVLSQSATRWAQGGVAAVLGGDEDSTDLHLADTLAAGADLCDEEAVRILVDEGPARVHELITLGVEFDRESTRAVGPGPGRWALAPARRPRRWRCHGRRGGASPGRRHVPHRERRAGRMVRPRSPHRGRALCGGDGTAPAGSCGGGPGRARRAGHGRGGSALLGHHQPARVDRGRRGHGTARRRADGGRRVRAVPPDGAAPSGHAASAALGGAARARGVVARRRGRPVRRRVGPARCGEPGHGGPHGRSRAPIICGWTPPAWSASLSVSRPLRRR